MPAISLVSADDPSFGEELTPERFAGIRKASARELLPHAARVALARGLRALAIRLRRTGLYRKSLAGPVPERIHFHTDDHRPRVLQDADALMRGRFRLGGYSVDSTTQCACRVA
jgi:uncharacterized heparinase superfamily protein